MVSASEVASPINQYIVYAGEVLDVGEEVSISWEYRDDGSGAQSIVARKKPEYPPPFDNSVPGICVEYIPNQKSAFVTIAEEHLTKLFDIPRSEEIVRVSLRLNHES